MQTRSLRLVFALCVASVMSLAACEKSGPKESGALPSDDLALLKQVPGGNVAVFGGNYMKLQNFMSSSMGKFATEMTTKAVGGPADNMKKWMECFTTGDVTKNLHMIGGVALHGGGVDMRLLMSGMTLAQVKACADKAGIKVAVDADGKYMAIEIYAGAAVASLANQSFGYLQLPSGALYARTSMGFGGVASVATANRAELEADQAALTKGSAADDKGLVALIAKVDRSKTVWFAGTGKATPIGDKMGDVYGTMDFNAGLGVDLTVQILNEAIANKVDEGVGQAKKMADQLPPDFKSIVDALQYSRSGDRLHFAAQLSDAQVGKLMKQAGGGMGIAN
jgi:hypothetical protein